MGDRVLVLPEKEPDRSRGGLIIPKTYKKDQIVARAGRVVKIGPGMLTFAGTWWTQLGELRLGDRILYNKMGVRYVTIEGIEYVSMHEEQVLLVIADDLYIEDV
jgi:co-chaperonin GroES (HSP10)